MIQNYYPIDFQAQYEETSEKMIEISKKYRQIILTTTPSSIQKIEDDLQNWQYEIEENDLLFRKQSIYSQFASGQLMAERRKQPPQMCPECGQQLKKQIQCQLCAEIYCKKCCYRNRVIPFASKQQKLCCQQCHFKFIKLLDNKQFYEEKEKLINVINFTRNKTHKIIQKIDQKKKEVEEVKGERRNQRIKEKNIEKKIQEEEKKMKFLEQELKKVVAEKAQKINLQNIRKQKQEEFEKQRAKQMEKQRLRKEQKEKQQKDQQQRKQAIEKKLKQTNQQSSRRNTQNGQVKQKTEKDKKNAEQKRIEGELKRKYQQQMKQKQQQIEQLKKALQQQKKTQKSSKAPSSKSSISSKRGSERMETPKQVTFDNKINQQKLVNTATTQSKQQKSEKQGSQLSLNEKQSKKSVQSSKKSVGSSKPNQSTPHVNLNRKTLQNQPSVKNEAANETKVGNEQPVDSLERSLSRMLRLSKQDESKSVVSQMSKTSKNIMDMSVNELLGMRIPMRSNSKTIQQQPEQRPQSDEEGAAAPEELIAPVSPLSSRGISVDRSSLKMQSISEQPVISKQQLQRDKYKIMRNSSLMSSTQNEGKMPEHVQGDARKCQCLIM